MKKTTKKASVSKQPDLSNEWSKSIRARSSGAMHENQVRAKKRQLKKKYSK